MKARYDGPIEPGMVFAAPGDDGRPLRRLRVLAWRPFIGDRPQEWIYEELPSARTARRTADRYPGELGSCPDVNLRLIFDLEGRDGRPARDCRPTPRPDPA